MQKPPLSFQTVTREQSYDSGLALVLVLLLVFFFGYRQEGVLVAAILALIGCMTLPRLFAPFAIVWLTVSYGLGLVMSRLLLSVIYFAVVVPVGLGLQLMRRDTAMRRSFQLPGTTYFSDRDVMFSGEDLEHPY